MSNFIVIPYDNFNGTVLVNVDELRKIELIFYKDETAVIEYHLNDEIIKQKFDYEYDPFLEHAAEWDKICLDGAGCNNNCEQCKLNMDFKEKYKHEGNNYNRRIANLIMSKLEKQLNVIDTVERLLDGEITVIKKNSESEV